MVCRITLAKKSFEVGTYVIVQKEKKDVQWEIRAIAPNGDVSLAPIDMDGVVNKAASFRVSLENFLSKYTQIKEKVKLMEGYPGNDASKSAELLKYALEGHVVTCVHSLTIEHANVEFRIAVSPFSKVEAKAAYEIGELIMVPATHAVSQLQPNKEINNDAYTCTLPEEDGEPVFVLAKPTGVKYTSPVWKCKMVSDRAVANCDVQTESGQYKAPMKSKGKLKDAIVQVVKKFKKVEVGDEIVIYKPAKTKTAQKKAVVASLGNCGPPSHKKTKFG